MGWARPPPAAPTFAAEGRSVVVRAVDMVVRQLVFGGGAQIDDGFFRQSEAIVRSMTREERSHPDIIDGSRRRRIARGSGATPSDVNRLLKQYKEAKRIMQQITTGRGAKISPLFG